MFSSIRIRLTIWYVSIFGLLLIAFSSYVYTFLARDLGRKFDGSLVRAAHGTINYFAEFVERDKTLAGAEETVRDSKFGSLEVAVAQENRVIAASSSGIASAIAATHIAEVAVNRERPLLVTEPRTDTRLAAVSVRLGGRRYVMVTSEPLAELNTELTRMRRTFFLGLPAALFLAAAGGFLLAGKSLQPIVTISDQAEHIGANNLDRRLHIPHPHDELGRLATVINSLLERLDVSFRVMREFMADASHELRTPLTIVQGEAEITLSQPRTNLEYRRSLALIREQSKRMARIVSDMLVLARADAGQQSVQFEELYLNDLVSECCEAAQTIARSAGVSLRFDNGEDLPFRGDEEILRRMVVNLLDNAIHYTLAGGSVCVGLQSDSSSIELTVIDTGVGIPLECQSRVFDRFYRVATSRKISDIGSGLGLSIVKLAAEAHSGSVEVSSRPGHGSTFTVKLPLSPVVKTDAASLSALPVER